MVVAPLRRRQLSEAAQVSLKRKKPPGKTGRFVVPGRAGANPEISAFYFSSGFRVQPAAAPAMTVSAVNRW
jgi:hypothetical protein